VPFLDCFAGSGACGIEALSRGAPAATFVEDDAGAARTIAENLRRTHLADRATIVRRDALRWLAAGRSPADGPFGIAIVDPPYQDTALLVSALGFLGDPTLGWLDPDAVVIAKHFWKVGPPDAAGGLIAVRDRRFGETALRHYRMRQPEQQEPDPG
jgi:16S rRNA (guanine966-N2)-methyltransferase